MKIWQLIVLEISLILMITILVIYLLSLLLRSLDKNTRKNRRYEDINPIRGKRYSNNLADAIKESNRIVKNYRVSRNLA